ncbi:MAG: RNA polymerase sigma factor [Acidobacteriota bacterium]
MKPTDSPDLDEKALVAGLREGTDEAFETLVRDFAGRILAVARRFLNNKEDAEDAVQEALLSVYRSVGSFEGGARLSTWVHRIAINAALMKVRSRRRHREESIEELLPKFQENGRMVELVREWKAPAERLLQLKETRATVRQSISQLPPNYRSVLLLRDIEELDTQETAGILGITANAVKIRLHRARQALRTLLASSFSTENGS